MVFSELYSAYYNAVAKMIQCAQEQRLTREEMYRIAEEKAFGESMLEIIPAIEEEKWQVIRSDMTTPLVHKVDMPLTNLQKRWLKAISMDPKMKLFDADFSFLDDVEPLFTPDDVVVFDKYLDGDNFEDEGYVARFKMICYAINNKLSLEIKLVNKNGETIKRLLQPQRLEYSKKDDKFRLIARGVQSEEIINLQKITHCKIKSERIKIRGLMHKREQHSVVFELTDERKALERALLHFAHFKKEAVQTGSKTYRITLWYDSLDETEMVIRILSFGPFIKVVEPESFVNLIKERLIRQKSCGI